MDPRYLDGRYANANPGWHNEDAAHKAAAALTLLREVGWSPRSVTDVGCGTGDVLRALREPLGPECALCGVDPAAPWGEADLDLRRGTVHDAPPAELALCFDVAEHLVDPVGLLRALGAVAPRALLRLPLDLSALDALRPARALRARATYGHLHAWTADLALAVITDAGWRPTAVRYDRVPPRLTTWRAWLTDGLRSVAFRAHEDRAVALFGGYSLMVAAEFPQPPDAPR